MDEITLLSRYRPSKTDINCLNDIIADCNWLEGFSVTGYRPYLFILKRGPLSNHMFGEDFQKTEGGKIYVQKPFVYDEVQNELYGVPGYSARGLSSIMNSGSDWRLISFLEQPPFCDTVPLPWYCMEYPLDVIGEPPPRAKADCDPIRIAVKLLTGKTITIRVDSGGIVHNIQTAIQDKEGIPPDQQHILFEGRELTRVAPISMSGIRNGSTLHLWLRLRGGMYDRSSGRDGFGILDRESPTIAVLKIKYGPGNSDELSIDVDRDEEVDTLLKMITKRIAEIRDLQGRIDSIKRGGGPPHKKLKSSDKGGGATVKQEETDDEEQGISADQSIKWPNFAIKEETDDSD